MGKSMNDFPRADYPSNEPWNPTKFKAECCGSIVFSARPGRFTSCECGKAAVDQTREYIITTGKLIEQGTQDDN